MIDATNICELPMKVGSDIYRGKIGVFGKTLSCFISDVCAKDLSIEEGTVVSVLVRRIRDGVLMEPFTAAVTGMKDADWPFRVPVPSEIPLCGGDKVYMTVTAVNIEKWFKSTTEKPLTRFVKKNRTRDAEDGTEVSA